MVTMTNGAHLRTPARRRLDWPTVLFWACWPILAVLVAVAVAALL